jgi:hypothetical protein
MFLFFWHTLHLLVGLLSVFIGGNFSNTCSFLMPSRRNGGSLAGALLGGLCSEGCDDDVDASEVVSEAADEADTAGESISLP